MNVPELLPVELHEALQSEPKPKLLDVRELDELEVCRLDIDAHIPLGELTSRYEELDPTEDWVVICRSGGRSGRAAAFLMSQGFHRVRNLQTGMNGWATTVDTTMQTY